MSFLSSIDAAFLILCALFLFVYMTFSLIYVLYIVFLAGRPLYKAYTLLTFSVTFYWRIIFFSFICFKAVCAVICAKKKKTKGYAKPSPKNKSSVIRESV